MAARTASVSGKWSATATWGGAAVPVDGDTVTINASVLVEFDVDQSGFANGLGASTINGTLYASRTAGTYYLKMNASLTVAAGGTLDASDGSNGTYPANCTFTIAFNGNFTISATTSTSNVTLRCGEPTHKYAKLTQNESAAATTLHVDTDLTGGGDALWASPSLVRVDDINQAQESEQYTISSVTSTTVVLTSGLTNAKSTGAYILLVSRNVKILGPGSTGTGITGGNSYPSTNVTGAEIRGLSVAFTTPTNHTINGTISGCASGLSATTANCIINAIITGLTGTACVGGYNCTVNGIISGCQTAISGTYGWIVSASAIITGCVNALNVVFGMKFYGKISGCGNALSTGNVNFYSASLLNNSVGLTSLMDVKCYNTLFTSSADGNYSNPIRSSQVQYSESYDHNQVVGAYKAWSMGGLTVDDTGTVYDSSRARSYKLTCETATYLGFFQREIELQPGQSVYVRCYVQKSVSMSYLPRLWVMSSDKEPIITGSPDSEVIMTNSTSTWEILETTVTNTATYPKKYIVRMLGKNASGNVWFDPIIRTSSYQPNPSMVGGMAA